MLVPDGNLHFDKDGDSLWHYSTIALKLHL
jgi:hypothetical protein